MSGSKLFTCGNFNFPKAVWWNDVADVVVVCPVGLSERWSNSVIEFQIYYNVNDRNVTAEETTTAFRAISMENSVRANIVLLSGVKLSIFYSNRFFVIRILR